MHRLKHTFIIAVCLILLLNVMPTAFANSTDSANELSHNDYSQALSEMIEYYEPIYGGFTTDENGIYEPIKTNRLIVKTNSNEPISDALGAVAKIEGYNEIHILQYSNSTSAEAAYNYFNTQDSIKYVEYDMYFCISEDEVSATEDVPDSGEHLSWGNSAIKSDIVNQMLISSNIELNEVIVAVFDSGLDVEHKRIDKSRICTGRNTWDAENPTDLVDYYEHGTKVAGIILDNTLPNVKIKPYKISNWYGGIYYSQMVDAIPVAVEDGVDVINMSFSYPGTDYKLFQENVNAAVNEGVSFVVASEIRRTKNITIRYMGTEKLELNPGEKIGAVYVANEDVITYEEYGKIKAHSIGETQVIAFIGNNRRITYNVTVEFAWWQFPHKIFYEWFGILLWSF